MPEISDSDTVIVRFANSVSYHRTSQRRALSRMPARMAAYFVWAIWIAYFLNFLLSLDPHCLFSEASVTTALWIIAGFFVAFNITPAVGIRRARPTPWLTDAPVTWRFAADRVACDIGTWEHRDFAWDALHSVDLLPDGLLIVPNQRLCHWIPKSAFDSEADYAQTLTWARQKARSFRQFEGRRAAEWFASCTLVPLALPLPHTAVRLLQGISEYYAAVSKMIYADMTPHYFGGYWLLAATVFLVLGRRNVQSPVPYAALALLLGLLWDGLVLDGFRNNAMNWIASTLAWLFAGGAHWWITVRTPTDE